MSSLLPTSGIPATLIKGVSERIEDGHIVLYPEAQRPFRRVLFVNSYGGAEVWRKVKLGELPPHHMWGCIELARMGYEVALADSIKHLSYRKPFPHDIPLFRFARRWLGPEDILFSGHTLLFWVPLLHALGALKCRLVSLTYAREELDLARFHSGIIAMTPAAADHAKKMAPRCKVVHLPWGCDLSFFPRLAYQPKWFLSCGITHRDLTTLHAATCKKPFPARFLVPESTQRIPWPPNVETIFTEAAGNHEKSSTSYRELFHEHYAGAIASLIILKHDPLQYTAVGFTNLIESLALGRPVVITQTGAVPTEIDVETAGCGLFVAPGEPDSLVAAITKLLDEPELGREMGKRARQLAESYYNIDRFALGLHRFFDTL
jgi:glycosyltransferase involved in cell wall biosynthesis